MKKSSTNNRSAEITSVKSLDITPEQDAWLTVFFIENHLDYYTYPNHAASSEQIRFMVYLKEDERYYPCSKRMFESIMSRKNPKYILKKYKEVYSRIVELIKEQIENEEERSYLRALIKIKYRHEIKDRIMIPSRLEKRLIRIYRNRTQIEDPYLNEKMIRNKRMSEFMNSDALKSAMDHMNDMDLTNHSKSLSSLRELANQFEIKRLLSLTSNDNIWESDRSSNLTAKDYQELLSHEIKGNGARPFFNFIGITNSSESSRIGKRILWIANEAGEIMVDLAMIRFLTNLGHKIIISLKEGPIFTKVDINDTQEDKVLNKELEGSLLVTEKNLSKNNLAKRIKSGYKIIVVSDGTHENLNLLLASKTFARIFKEVDAVISRGPDQRHRFFETDFQFTQDIFNISANPDKSIDISFKPRHPGIIKFSHSDLEKKALTIIGQMKTAKNKGMTVAFYSGIIGSIPGKIKMAKKIMSTFIKHWKEQSAMTFIINPSEFYEPGMDADDLMYMWEIVQRSGCIDIWRFQTYDDIALAFEILKIKIPPEWVGKDATYSTGCTKEMKIAIEVQIEHPEMQVIGPAKEKFMRRDEYGMGKMYDRRL